MTVKPTLRFVVLGILILGSEISAQEIDTALTTNTQAKRFTILDQIEDRAEREAFTRLYKETGAANRRAMAVSFISAWPGSWLLGEAYEIAAKASIDMGDLTAALDYGEKSLRLWPENVLLLVPLADVEAKLKMFDKAVATANTALWCLDRFDRPSSISESDWPRIQRALRASAYFVLGRVAAMRGLATTGPQQTHALEEADRWLVEALKLDQHDAEALYLAGLVRSSLKRPEAASACFAEVRRLNGAFRDEALIELKKIYAASGARGGASFENWAGSLKFELPPAPKPDVAQALSPVQRKYAGSQACAACHEREYEAWKATGMGRMFREYRPEIVSGDFSRTRIFEDESGEPAAKVSIDHGRHEIAIRGANREWSQYPVEYIIGSKWQQAYATRFPDGHIQVFPIQFNLLKGTWVNYWKTIDPPESARTDVHRFSEEVPAATYQLNCAPCHTSQLRFRSRNFEAGGTSFLEGGINCEMCHGPSAAHVVAMRAERSGDTSSATEPVDFNRITPEKSVAICAQCHKQSGVRTPETDGAVNFSERGAAFYRDSPSRPYVDFSRKAFYKDGRFRMTTFIVESFVRSACFRKGGAACASCHDPHPSNAAANPVSLKFAPDSNEMCLQCHTELRSRIQAHTHHSPDAEASRCVSCHMPKIMEAVLFNARSHQIDDIPDAQMAARFGREGSPNACLMCHEDKDAQWLTRELRKWRD